MLIAVLLSTLAAGTLDLAATCSFMKSQGVHPLRILQMVASGVLGERAFQETQVSAPLGLALHFMIAAVLSLLYAATTPHIALLWLHPVAAGVLFGLAVHSVMAFVVVPCSRVPRRPFVLKRFFVQAAIHVVCVGLPIAEITMRCLPRN